MSKKTVVLFEEGSTPRVYINPPSLEDLQKRGKILINPAIPRGVPPEQWYVKNDEIFPKGKKRARYNLEKSGPKKVYIFYTISIIILCLDLLYRLFISKISNLF